MDLLTRQDHRKLGLARRTDDAEHAERSAQRDREEEFDATQRDGHACAGPLPHLNHVEEVRAEFLLRDQIGRLREMLGQLPYGANVRLLRPDR